MHSQMTEENRQLYDRLVKDDRKSTSFTPRDVKPSTLFVNDNSKRPLKDVLEVDHTHRRAR